MGERKGDLIAVVVVAAAALDGFLFLSHGVFSLYLYLYLSFFLRLSEHRKETLSLSR